MVDDDEDSECSEAHARWEAVHDEFLMFRNIPEEERPCSSEDVCAFVYLDKLFPDEKNRDMVSSAEHDEIWLRITEEQIAMLTDVDILYLTRCGVIHDDEYDGLSMFV